MTLPKSWIRQISSALIAKDAVPLTGAAPEFPWEQFSGKLAETFRLDRLEIAPSDAKWREAKDFFSHIPNPMPLHFSLPSIGGSVGWLMPRDDVSFLMRRLLIGEEAAAPIADDSSLTESFLQFMALEAVHNFAEVKFDGSLAPQLLKEGAFPEEAALCYDITISLPERQLFGRVVLSPEFRQSWVDRHREQAKKELYRSERNRNLEVELHLEIGQTALPYSEWRQVRRGDLLILQNCSWNLEKKSARVTVTAEEIPLFQGKLKEGSIKIIGAPLHQEVETPMDRSPQEEEKEEEEEFELPEDELGEEVDLGDEPLDDENEEEEKPAAEEEKEPEEKKQAIRAEEEEQPVFSPDKVPLSLSIEIGRVRMTLEKLAELEPGNVIELAKTPESGVDIVFKGKCVGRGELVQAGDLLGVRITEL